MKQLLFCLLLLCMSGCVTTQAPLGVDNSIFSQTKKRSSMSSSNGKNTRLSYIEGPVFQIDSNPINIFSLIKFKDNNGEIRYRVIYKYIGIWTASATEIYTNTLHKTDLIMQEDMNGYVLETGAIDIERNLIESCLGQGMKLVLTSKGNGTVFTPTPEMTKAMNREDWDAIKKMRDNGEGHQSKYKITPATINIPPAYLKAFLAKSDLIELQ